MLTQEILDRYKELKRKKDAAYLVFKKEPTMINATKHAGATQAFTSFCIETMEALAGEEDNNNEQEDILANIEKYKTCKQCEREVLYQVDAGHFIRSSEFVEDFPGWCHSCLIDHCREVECQYCSLIEDYENCPYKEIKNIYMSTED